MGVLVGFEREIKEMKETLESDKSNIYRSITRAKQLVAIVTEPMPGGWFTDIGQGTKFNDDKEKLKIESENQVLLKGIEKKPVKDKDASVSQNSNVSSESRTRID